MERILKRIIGLMTGCICLLNSAHAQEHPFTNELIHETSPYLLQHAHNPVNWYPWGEEALKKAKEEDKMLLISVGYSACHWCHVMEHESFEDTAVARFMNEHFVCIKVDREERPDVDQVYMNAAQVTTGRSGWPLNALAISDGKPFYAGTYFPKNQWMGLMNKIVDLKKYEPEVLLEQAVNVTSGINQIGAITLNEEASNFSKSELESAFEQFLILIDPVKGGRDGSPKFPVPPVWEYVLDYGLLMNDERALDAFNTTLKGMAYGGIYDHVGGGFSRYSTDEDWHIPHFEKMLYDNAQLVSLYSHAWRLTKNPLYRDAVCETLAFIEREMTASNGGFYSSIDADSEGVEGKFYVWSSEEIREHLGKDAKLFLNYYNCSNRGNWEEGNNVLKRTESNEVFSEKHAISEKELQNLLARGKKKLFAERSKRIRPRTDDKQLTSWNALMLRAYVDAYRAFGDREFLKAAQKNACYLKKHVITDTHEIMRNYKNGTASISGFLDDYAFVISSFIALYQVTFDEKWLNEAQALTEYTIEKFYDEQTGMFFYTNTDGESLISRKMEIQDNVIAASNSEMALNLFTLGSYFSEERYINLSKQMLSNVQKDVHESTYFYANWARLEMNFVFPPYEVAIVGKDRIKMQRELDEQYFPGMLLYGSDAESALELLEGKYVKGQTTIYVCQNKACKFPVTSVSEARQLLTEDE